MDSATSIPQQLETARLLLAKFQSLALPAEADQGDHW